MAQADTAQQFMLPVLMGHWTTRMVTSNGKTIEPENMLVESYSVAIDPRTVLAVNDVRPEAIGRVIGELEEKGYPVIPGDAKTIIATSDGEFHYSPEPLCNALQQLGGFRNAADGFTIPPSSALARLIDAAEQDGRSVVGGRPGIKTIVLNPDEYSRR